MGNWTYNVFVIAIEYANTYSKQFVVFDIELNSILGQCTIYAICTKEGLMLCRITIG